MLHIKMFGEQRSADKVAANTFPEKFKQLVKEGGYSPQQDFFTSTCPTGKCVSANNNKKNKNKQY